MNGHRIHKETLEQKLPATLREQYRLDGLPSTHLPSWEYIRANTRYSAQGLNNKSKQLYDMTILEFLRSQGFGIPTDGEWPTDDEDTIESLEYLVTSLKDRSNYKDSTIKTVESTINKIYEAIQEEGIDVELLELGSHDSTKEFRENIQTTLNIIDYMTNDLDVATVINYAGYYSKYYEMCENNFPINQNPVEDALDEYNWSRANGDPQPVSKKEINVLWNTLDNLDECPIEGYHLDTWRCWMKALIVFFVAVGPRSKEIEELNVIKQLHFGDDPYIHFERRKNLDEKNGSEEVPIMFGSNFLQAYQEYIRLTNEKETFIPSSESESGCMTPATLNNWLEELCQIANVRSDDETTPTIQNFRQFWTERYKKAVHENRDEIKRVSDEKGTKTPEVDKDNYMRDTLIRKHVRNLGRKHFDNVLEIEALPNQLQEVLNQNEYIGRQAELGEYGDY